MEHLFHALLIVGGQATRALEDAGITLGAAREAVATEHRERVRSLGLVPPVVAARHSIPDPDDTDTDFSERALAALQRKITGPFDLGLFGHLLDEPSRLVPAVLLRVGVDPGAVRTAALAAGLPDEVTRPVAQDVNDTS